jgi:acyl carrier protein
VNDLHGRLRRCFAAVFPSLPESHITAASVDTMEGWDSVAAATLITTIEEEFSVEFDMDAGGNLTSYAAIAQELERASHES